jgi:hypothetical protein
MPVEAPEIIEVDTTRVCLRRHRRRARPSAGLSGNGRRELRRMPLLRPPLCAEAGSARALTASATHRPVKKGDHLYLIDGSGYLFRAYHALPPLSRKSDGLAHQRGLRLFQHAVEAAGRHESGRQAHPSGGDLRRGQEDVPQRHLPALQGQPPRAARRSHSAIPAGARSDARLRRFLRSKSLGFEADDLIATYARMRAKRARASRSCRPTRI